MAAIIIFSLISIAIILALIRSFVLKRRFLKALNHSPDLLALFKYAKGRGINVEAAEYSEDSDKDRWEWRAHYQFLALSRLITVPFDAKTRHILPLNPFLQKIILAHEISHLEQKNQYLEVRYSCKKILSPCLYLELDAWYKTCELLTKLNLFSDEKEIRKFWNYVRSKPRHGKFIPCHELIKNGDCPKTLEFKNYPVIKI